MRTRFWLLAGVVVVIAAAVPAAEEAGDPFAFFDPSVKVTARDRARLDRDEVIVQSLPADDGHLAVFAATRLNAPPEVLLAWTRAIEAFKKGFQVVRVGRFSDPVADSDLDALVLENDELDALRKCRVGTCELKLGAAEIAEIQDATRAAGKGWREAAQHAFRRVLIARVRLHRQRGLLALPPYADRSRRMSVGEAFSAIVARSPYLTRALPDVVNSLLAPPPDAGVADESFYYWSHDSYGAGRPIVTVTYVRLLRRNDPGVPLTMTISTQLFASHYTEGALGLTAVTCDDARTACYLVYLNRTQVDFLGGFFGAFKRSAIERRIESETPELLRDVRQRLESDAPDNDDGPRPRTDSFARDARFSALLQRPVSGSIPSPRVYRDGPRHGTCGVV